MPPSWSCYGYHGQIPLGNGNVDLMDADSEVAIDHHLRQILADSRNVEGKRKAGRGNSASSSNIGKSSRNVRTVKAKQLGEGIDCISRFFLTICTLIHTF